jgi:nucleoside-diphosphate-sugar epimerase
MFSVVTGGAGFIGSHLIDALVSLGDEVLIIDALTAGSKENIAWHLDMGDARLLVLDLCSDGWQEAMSGAARVYHLAADPDVRQSALDPGPAMKNNIIATSRVLEAMRAAGVPEIVFTSTSTVYGDAAVIPTPENYTPLEPISVYGAMKVEAEALVRAEHAGALVIRTSLLVGESGTMLRPAYECDGLVRGQSVALYRDEWRSPTHVDDLVHASWQLASLDVTGVYHVAGAERLSRLELGRILAALFRYKT